MLEFKLIPHKAPLLQPATLFYPRSPSCPSAKGVATDRRPSVPETGTPSLYILAPNNTTGYRHQTGASNLPRTNPWASPQVGRELPELLSPQKPGADGCAGGRSAERKKVSRYSCGPRLNEAERQVRLKKTWNTLSR